MSENDRQSWHIHKIVWVMEFAKTNIKIPECIVPSTQSLVHFCLSTCRLDYFTRRLDYFDSSTHFSKCRSLIFGRRLVDSIPSTCRLIDSSTREQCNRGNNDLHKSTKNTNKV